MTSDNQNQPTTLGKADDWLTIWRRQNVNLYEAQRETPSDPERVASYREMRDMAYAMWKLARQLEAVNDD